MLNQEKQETFISSVHFLTLLDLPNEILILIFGLLNNSSELASIAKSCKFLREVSQTKSLVQQFSFSQPKTIKSIAGSKQGAVNFKAMALANNEPFLATAIVNDEKIEVHLHNALTGKEIVHLKYDFLTVLEKYDVSLTFTPQDKYLIATYQTPCWDEELEYHSEEEKEKNTLIVIWNLRTFKQESYLDGFELSIFNNKPFHIEAISEDEFIAAADKISLFPQMFLYNFENETSYNPDFNIGDNFYRNMRVSNNKKWLALTSVLGKPPLERAHFKHHLTIYDIDNMRSRTILSLNTSSFYFINEDQYILYRESQKHLKIININSQQIIKNIYLPHPFTSFISLKNTPYIAYYNGIHKQKNLYLHNILTGHTALIRENVKIRELMSSSDGSKLYLVIQNHQTIHIESINIRPHEKTQELNNTIVPRL